jgi:putative ABC transport system substrate-binding protein
LADAEVATVAIKRRMVAERAASEGELAPAITRLLKAGAGGLVLGGSPFFASHRSVLIRLSADHSLPAIYDLRDYVVEGGLISYSGSFTQAYHLAGGYVSKILKGTLPADLPVQQPSNELAVNLKTARRSA